MLKKSCHRLFSSRSNVYSLLLSPLAGRTHIRPTGKSFLLLASKLNSSRGFIDTFSEKENQYRDTSHSRRVLCRLYYHLLHCGENKEFLRRVIRLGEAKNFLLGLKALRCHYVINDCTCMLQHSRTSTSTFLSRARVQHLGWRLQRESSRVSLSFLRLRSENSSLILDFSFFVAILFLGIAFIRIYGFLLSVIRATEL